ncbi:MAG: hypothetical protein OXM61_16760 [Candidatus Poribacteria bacterium]|nr:hypothetical protein [Candidatus Poribacteria bacterium]
MDYLVETFKTGLTYDPNQDFGNANAGKNLWVSLSADDTVQLAANNASLVGRLLEVRQNGTASVEVFAQKTKAVAAEAVPRGSGLIGAGGGKVKPAVAASTRPRGLTLKAAANDNDVIDVALIC